MSRTKDNGEAIGASRKKWRRNYGKKTNKRADKGKQMKNERPGGGSSEGVRLTGGKVEAKASSKRARRQHDVGKAEGTTRRFLKASMELRHWNKRFMSRGLTSQWLK